MLPVFKQLKTKPATKAVKLLVARGHEYTHGEKTVCKTVPVLDVRMQMLDKQHIHIDTLNLHHPSDVWNAGQHHQRGFV